MNGKAAEDLCLKSIKVHEREIPWGGDATVSSVKIAGISPNNLAGKKVAATARDQNNQQHLLLVKIGTAANRFYKV